MRLVERERRERTLGHGGSSWRRAASNLIPGLVVFPRLRVLPRQRGLELPWSSTSPTRLSR
eukprot:307175-Hanusia_phi.AAC.1